MKVKYTIQSCAMCGKGESYATPAKWQDSTVRDLDGRTENTDVFDFKNTVTRCTHCGYVSDDITKKIIEDDKIIQSEEYKKTINSNMPRSVSSFIALGYLHEKQGRYYEASRAYICASWVLSDDGQQEQSNKMLNQACYCILIYIKTKEFKANEDVAVLQYAVDILRRVGRFEYALTVINHAMSLEAEDDVVSALIYERTLCDQKDSNTHAIKQMPLPERTFSQVVTRFIANEEADVNKKLASFYEMCNMLKKCNVKQLQGGIDIIINQDNDGEVDEDKLTQIAKMLEKKPEVIEEKVEEVAVIEPPKPAPPRIIRSMKDLRSDNQAVASVEKNQPEQTSAQPQQPQIISQSQAQIVSQPQPKIISQSNKAAVETVSAPATQPEIMTEKRVPTPLKSAVELVQVGITPPTEDEILKERERREKIRLDNSIRYYELEKRILKRAEDLKNNSTVETPVTAIETPAPAVVEDVQEPTENDKSTCDFTNVKEQSKTTIEELNYGEFWNYSADIRNEIKNNSLASGKEEYNKLSENIEVPAPLFTEEDKEYVVAKTSVEEPKCEPITPVVEEVVEEIVVEEPTAPVIEEIAPVVEESVTPMVEEIVEEPAPMVAEEAIEEPTAPVVEEPKEEPKEEDMFVNFWSTTTVKSENNGLMDKLNAVLSQGDYKDEKPTLNRINRERVAFEEEYETPMTEPTPVVEEVAQDVEETPQEVELIDYEYNEIIGNEETSTAKEIALSEEVLPLINSENLIVNASGMSANYYNAMRNEMDKELLEQVEIATPIQSRSEDIPDSILSVDIPVEPVKLDVNRADDNFNFDIVTEENLNIIMSLKAVYKKLDVGNVQTMFDCDYFNAKMLLMDLERKGKMISVSEEEYAFLED